MPPAGFQAFGTAGNGFVGSGFTPGALGAALQLWLRGEGATPGATFTWADQSGKGDSNRNATQSTGANQPTINASDAGYNGRTTLSFGSDDFLASGVWSVTVAQPWSMFVVGNDDGTATLRDYFETGSAAGGGANRAFLRQEGTGVYGVYAGTTVVTGGVVSSAKRVLGGIVNGASSQLLVSAKTPVASGNAGASSPLARYWIGTNFSGANEFLNGKIAEIVVMSGVASAAQISSLMDYFGARYDIAIGP